MQTADEARVERRVLRRLHRLRLIADLNAPYRLRVAAVKAIQSSLQDGNPLKARNPEQLLREVRLPWFTARETVWQPTTLSDIWDLNG